MLLQPATTLSRASTGWVYNLNASCAPESAFADSFSVGCSARARVQHQSPTPWSILERDRHLVLRNCILYIYTYIFIHVKSKAKGCQGWTHNITHIVYVCIYIYTYLHLFKKTANLSFLHNWHPSIYPEPPTASIPFHATATIDLIIPRHPSAQSSAFHKHRSIKKQTNWPSN